MRRPLTWTRTVVGAVGLALVGAFAVTSARASFAGSGEPSPVDISSKSKEDFPINASGQSYGSTLEARTPQDAPDLIASIGTNGREGYVRKIDMMGPLPSTPAEAIALMEQQLTAGTRCISLYLSDGITVVGEFQIS